MIPRLLNIQGIAGLAASLALFGLLVLQKGETRHWRKQSAGFEQLYHGEQAALAGTTANYRAAADAARAADRAANEQTRAAQLAINERTTHEFQARITAARTHTSGLRGKDSPGSADSSGGRTASMSALPPSSGSTPQAAGEDRLPEVDALIATEQAIQLDELIKWVRLQSAVDPNSSDRR